MTKIYILGGAQTDFSENWTRANRSLFDLFSHAVLAGLEDAQLEPADIEVGHVSNFVAELFTRQGMLGGFLAMCIRISPGCRLRVTRGRVLRVL